LNDVFADGKNDVSLRENDVVLRTNDVISPLGEIMKEEIRLSEFQIIIFPRTQ
jgi:hypothetical protein